MTRKRRAQVSPGTAIALIALFFALGGSAFAIGERTQGPTAAQQRCANGSVRGVATVTGNPAQGIANIPDQFTSSPVLFSRRFNCTGKAIQVRRAEIGVYEIRFVGNAAPSAIASGVGQFSATSETLGPGLFRIRVQDVGRASSADGPFMVTVV
jgi:hypothetical protein